MAAKVNLVVDQGADFLIALDVTDLNDIPVELSSFTASAQMRKTYTSATYTAFEASINTTSESIILELSSAQTANLTSGRYVYDVVLTSSNNVVSRIVEGIVTVTPRVTR